MLKKRLTEFCLSAYPDAELKFDFDIENASGCARGFEVWIDDGIDHDDEFDIIQAIQNEFNSILYLMEQSGEIYE